MDEEITFGPLAQGIYKALLWATLPLAVVSGSIPSARWVLPYHVALIVFLGLGLKPFLRHTGLYRLWMILMAEAQQKRHASHHAEAARRVERKIRDEKLRKSRVRDPRLPKRW
jgi:hypothetical protein